MSRRSAWLVWAPTNHASASANVAVGGAASASRPESQTLTSAQAVRRLSGSSAGEACPPSQRGANIPR